MNIKKLSIAAALLTGISLAGTGCKKYLDVNTNPNVAQNAGPEFLLPSAQIYLASSVGVDLQVNGSIWAQYWTQSPSASQYKIYEQYSPTASTYDRVWTLLYANCLADLDQMERKATVANQQMYVGIARLMKAYTFQVITDGWDAVPYSEALKGQDADGGIVSPHFDPQTRVYDSLIGMTKGALAILGTVPSGSTVTGDLIYGGVTGTQLTNWRKFGSTLLLKLGMRLSEKDPARAQATVAAAFATGYGFISGAADEAQIQFSTTAGNQNPLYSEEVGLSKTQNLVGSATSLDSLTKGNTAVPFDARTYFFFKPSGTSYVGIPQGAYTLPASTAVAIPSANVGADANNTASATAPVKFMTPYESLFLQAEAAARGWGAGNDATLFTQAVTASFNESNVGTAPYGSSVLPTTVTLRDSFPGVPKSAATTFALTPSYALYRYLNGDTLTGFLRNAPVTRTAATWGKYPTGGSTQDRIRYIITNKWFAMTGLQGFEAWTEWRRTGYPDWFRISANSLLPRTPGNFPHRLLYPDAEVQRNQNFPGQKQVTDRVYWDVH